MRRHFTDDTRFLDLPRKKLALATASTANEFPGVNRSFRPRTLGVTVHVP